MATLGNYKSSNYSTSDPDATLAAVTRGEWDDFIDKFGDRLMNDLIPSLGDYSGVGKAGERASLGFSNQQGVESRNLERLGRSPNQRTLGANQSRNNSQRGLETVNARNVAKRNQIDRDLSLSSSLMDLGRGIGSQSMDSLGAAGSLAAQLEATNAQIRASNSNKGIFGLFT
ncbi:MAG: hypothetical protein HOE82_11110 [Gammaproteobacteria bacterium]|nr:hypothetical protein [Gammaproteobacteria bacterium]